LTHDLKLAEKYIALKPHVPAPKLATLWTQETALLINPLL